MYHTGARMAHGPKLRKVCLQAVLACMICAAHGRAQTKAPLAENVFKNVQVLKGIPVDQFMGTMGIIAASAVRGNRMPTCV